ncbi:hypothetical protein GGX14DRAFT_392118 [Mycena pura]|uniref:Uncharacterized protein n=1 Tax=Mycena pura TaxID=153505 RepID=A0AAD6VN43_9AGAR|nr:hypothetical protein GGX14DRAFT_392118 [Mycena pura]
MSPKFIVDSGYSREDPPTQTVSAIASDAVSIDSWHRTSRKSCRQREASLHKVGLEVDHGSNVQIQFGIKPTDPRLDTRMRPGSAWTYTWLTIFIVQAWKTKQKLRIYKALQLVEGDQNTANIVFTIALDAFTNMNIHRDRAECTLQLGNISQMVGDFGKAEEFWKLAQPLFERLTQGKKVALIDEKLLSIHPYMHMQELLPVVWRQGKIIVLIGKFIVFLYTRLLMEPG